MGWTIPTNPIDISAVLPASGSWQDVDLSAYVPAGTKQVWIRVRNTDSGTTIGLRPNGSSAEANYKALAVDSFEVFGVKLDANRVLELNGAGGYSITAHIIAYSDADTLWLDPVDKSLATTGSYQTQSDAGVAAGAGLVALEAIMGIGNVSGGYRPNDESYDYYKSNLSNYRAAILVGVDGSQQWAQQISGAALDCYLWGYLLDAGRPAGEPGNFAPAVGDWRDVDLSGVLPEGAVAAVFQVINGSATAYGAGFRHPDSTENLVDDIDVYGNHQLWTIVGVDSSRHCEIWLENAALACRLVGWLTGSAPTPGQRTFPLPRPETVWQSQANKRTFPLPGEQE